MFKTLTPSAVPCSIGLLLINIAFGVFVRIAATVVDSEDTEEDTVATGVGTAVMVASVVDMEDIVGVDSTEHPALYEL